MPGGKKGASKKNKKEEVSEEVPEEVPEEEPQDEEEGGDEEPPEADEEEGEEGEEAPEEEEDDAPPKARSKSKKMAASPSAPSNSGDAPIRYRVSEVDFANVEVGKMDMSASQPMAHINYYNNKLQSDTKLLCQMKKIKITGHGIPPLHDEYCPDDTKREFMKIPLDDGQEGCRELRAHLEAADEFYGSEEMKAHLFGAKAGDYEYQKCIRVPENKDKDDDNSKKKKKKGSEENGEKKKYPIYDYCKMKFNMSNTRSKDGKKSKEPAVNLTKLKRQNSDGTTIVTPAETITQIAGMIPFQSDVTIIFYHTRVWAMKTKLNGKRLYGVALKMMFILYTPSANRGGVKSDDLDLLPSDEDDDDEGAKPAKPAKKAAKPTKTAKSDKPAKPAKSTKKAKLDDDEEEEAAEEPAEEEGEEEEEIPVSKKKKKSKVAKEEDEGGEEEEEEEAKPAKKKGGKSASKSRE